MIIRYTFVYLVVEALLVRLQLLNKYLNQNKESIQLEATTMGIISDQEKLTRWHYNWVNSANPVTANSWRNMYVRLYLELYLCT